MTHTYKTKGTCAQAIEIEISDNNIIENVRFIGGCKGNTQGISALVKGMDAKDVIDRLSGIKCGFKPTSCPDQLSVALKSIIGE